MFIPSTFITTLFLTALSNTEFKEMKSWIHLCIAVVFLGFSVFVLSGTTPWDAHGLHLVLGDSEDHNKGQGLIMHVP